MLSRLSFSAAAAQRIMLPHSLPPMVTFTAVFPPEIQSITMESIFTSTRPTFTPVISETL